MRYDPMTTALVMWIFGFACGALACWVRGLRAKQNHDRAMSELDAFIRPQACSKIDPRYNYRAFDKRGKLLLATVIRPHNKAFGQGRR